MKKIGFRLIKNEIDQFAVFENNFTGADKHLMFDSSLHFHFNVNTLTLTCSCAVTCNSQTGMVATGAVSFTYEFEPSSINELRKEDVLSLPEDLLVFLGSKTYGALRGVMLAKLEPTTVRLTIPLEDLSDIIDKPLEIKLR